MTYCIENLVTLIFNFKFSKIVFLKKICLKIWFGSKLELKCTKIMQVPKMPSGEGKKQLKRQQHST